MKNRTLSILKALVALAALVGVVLLFINAVACWENAHINGSLEDKAGAWIQALNGVFSIISACSMAFIGTLFLKEYDRPTRKEYMLIVLLVFGGVTFLSSFLSLCISGNWMDSFDWTRSVLGLGVIALALLSLLNVGRGKWNNLFALFAAIIASSIILARGNPLGLASRSLMELFVFVSFAVAFLLRHLEREEAPLPVDSKVEPEPEDDKVVEEHPEEDK